MKKITRYIALLMVGLLAFGCTEDDAITVDEHFMDYDIPLMPVESDYIVGAHFVNTIIKDAVTEVPNVAIKEPGKGDPEAYAQYVTQAQTAGIDYFLFTLRSNNVAEGFKADSAYMDTIFRATNASEMKFALSYNFGSMGLSNNNRIEDVGLVPTLLNDFELMMPYFQMDNYMKVDGKCVVYLPNSHNLYANDNVALYQQLREQMTGLGVELYLIGMQNEWTPPLRYDFRFVDCVDAVTHSTYANIAVSWYDRLELFHRMCDQAWMYHKETFEEYNIEYIPTIVPSFSPIINNASSSNFVIEKDAEWFKAHCNVARRTTGAHKLILLDSFNDFNRDTQVESTESYGDTFLNLLKSEFKVN